MKLQNKLRLIYVSEFLIYFHLFGGVLIPFFTEWGGLTLTQVMMIQAWFSLCVLLFEIPTGTLADTIGRKNTVVLSYIINVIGVVLYVAGPSIWTFLLAETFWALSMALASGAKEALVYDTLIDHGEDRQSQRAFGRFKISHLWGLIISAPIGSFIGHAWGYEWAVLLMIIPFSLAALILLFLPEPKARELPEGQTRAPFVEQMVQGWTYFRGHPYLLYMTFDMVVIWTLSFMIVWFQQVVLQRIGVPESTFGWFVTYALVCQIIVLALAPRLERWFGSKKNMLTFGGLLPTLGFALLAFFPSVPTVLLALFLCCGFGLTRRTLYATYMNRFIASHQRATVNSYINMGINVVGLLVKPITGILADISLVILFSTLAVACLLVTVFSRVKEEMLLD